LGLRCAARRARRTKPPRRRRRRPDARPSRRRPPGDPARLRHHARFLAYWPPVWTAIPAARHALGRRNERPSQVSVSVYRTCVPSSSVMAGMSVAWSRHRRRALSVTIAHPRRFEFQEASSTRESKRTAWVRRRSAEFLSESDEKPFRSADVAEAIRVF